MNLTALAEISIKTCLQNVRQGYGFLLLRTAETGGIKTDEKQQPMIMAENGPESSADFEFNASACGDNCAKWILKIAETKDLTINLRHIMDFGEEPFEAVILNTGETVHDMLEFIKIAGEYV